MSPRQPLWKGVMQMAFGNSDYRVIMRFQNSSVGSTWANVMAGRLVAGTQQHVADDFANAWQASGSIQDGTSNDVELIDIVVERLDGSVDSLVAPVSVAGAHADNSAIVQMALVTTWTTGGGGRRGRGRTYWGGLADGYIDDTTSRWSFSAHTPHLDNMVSAFAGYLDGAHGNNTELAVASNVNQALRVVTSWTVHDYPGTQRRRAQRLQ